MGKRIIYATMSLTFVWIILVEGFTWKNVAIGMLMSLICLYVISTFLNLKKIKNIKFYKLAVYPFWLISRIYMDAFSLIKLILTDAKWGIVKTQLELDNDTLNTVLADSITLTPGTIYLEREGKDITLLCIGDTKKHGYLASIDGLREIEKILQKAHIDADDDSL